MLYLDQYKALDFIKVCIIIRIMKIKKKSDAVLLIRLPQDLLERMRLASIDKKLSMSELTRQMIRRSCNARKRASNKEIIRDD